MVLSCRCWYTLDLARLLRMICNPPLLHSSAEYPAKLTRAPAVRPVWMVLSDSRSILRLLLLAKRSVLFVAVIIVSRVVSPIPGGLVSSRAALILRCKGTSLRLLRSWEMVPFWRGAVIFVVLEVQHRLSQSLFNRARTCPRQASAPDQRCTRGAPEVHQSNLD